MPNRRAVFLKQIIILLHFLCVIFNGSLPQTPQIIICGPITNLLVQFVPRGAVALCAPQIRSVSQEGPSPDVNILAIKSSLKPV